MVNVFCVGLRIFNRKRERLANFINRGTQTIISELSICLSNQIQQSNQNIQLLTLAKLIVLLRAII